MTVPGFLKFLPSLSRASTGAGVRVACVHVYLLTTREKSSRVMVLFLSLSLPRRREGAMNHIAARSRVRRSLPMYRIGLHRLINIYAEIITSNHMQILISKIAHVEILSIRENTARRVTLLRRRIPRSIFTKKSAVFPFIFIDVIRVELKIGQRRRWQRTRARK